MQYLFFSLIPVGLILLTYSIKFSQKAFSGSLLLEFPYLQITGEFTIEKPGTYSIWHKGPFFRKAPLDEFKPEIIYNSTGEKLKLSSNLFRPNTNNGINARMELFRFKATPGNYKIKLESGKSISRVENTLLKLIPAPNVKPEDYFIQVRECRPFYQVIFGILFLTISGLLIIGGLIFGILSEEIFN